MNIMKLKCTCGLSHKLSVEKIGDIYQVSIIEDEKCLYDRIRLALKFIFKGHDLYYNDIIINEKSAHKLIKFIKN
jgi:hypothetical protein